ncbi:proline-rich transmembrane protein 4 [Microcaecilia unicolor]|uniref:Proline-rich transmembrane protein 4 n=1 Tax=Microcaecilia unicolor TaxID=1415580 RepID=A0A6P7ZA47_9AMPH|nr:proline-rich transmembrane protein 4 [Microcaecilia unicolor]
MGFITWLHRYCLTVILMDFRAAGTTTEALATLSLSQTHTSPAEKLQHPSTDQEALLQVSLVATRITSEENDDAIVSPAQNLNPEISAGNYEPIRQGEGKAVFNPELLYTGVLLEDKTELSSSINLLTPVNKYWTELPQNRFTPVSLMPSSHFLVTESVEEPFYDPSQHAPGNNLILSPQQQSTHGWDDLPAREEANSVASRLSLSPPSGWQWTSSQLPFDSEFLNPVPTVELSSSYWPTLDIKSLDVKPTVLPSLDLESKPPLGIHQANYSPGVELKNDYLLKISLEEGAGVIPTRFQQERSAKEEIPDLASLLPPLPSLKSMSTLEKQDTVAYSDNLAPTKDGTLASSASTWPEYNHEKSTDCTSSMSLSPSVQDVEATAHVPSYFLPSPPLFITLHADWNSAMSDWGIAWEVHIYGVGSLFGLVAFISLLSLLCLPFRCPAGCKFFIVLDLLLLTVGCSRAFSLFYDAYSHQERLPAFVALLLYDVTFPCLTSSFGVVFLLLSLRSKMQLSHSWFQHPCVLAAVVFLHFLVSVGAIVTVDLLHQFPFLLVISQGVFVIMAAILSISFFIFYCLVKSDTMLIYDLKSSMLPTNYLNRYPFVELADWSRATHTALFSATFGLFNAGLHLYAILHALGYGGTHIFSPWPWWTFQLGFRLCELGMSLPLALVGIYPVFCSNETQRFRCWTKFFCLSPSHVTMKAPILSNDYQWASSQHEKLVICDTIARRNSEFFPLYTVVEKHMSFDEDIDLTYHSSKSMENQGCDMNMKTGCESKTSSFTSIQMDSDSTVDFRPPSPINLRRSIDEALFSEALIPKSLFHGTALSSNFSLNIKSPIIVDNSVLKEKITDRGLYRTSSCLEMETAQPRENDILNTSKPDTSVSSPEKWRRGKSSSSSLYKLSMDGSSLVLCSSPEKVDYSSSFNFEKKAYVSLPQTNSSYVPQVPGLYQTLPPPSQNSLDCFSHQDTALQEEFVDIYRQIDTLSISSDTIDL